MPQSYWRFCNPSVADIRQHDRVHDQRWGDIPNAPRQQNEHDRYL